MASCQTLDCHYLRLPLRGSEAIHLLKKREARRQEDPDAGTSAAGGPGDGGVAGVCRPGERHGGAAAGGLLLGGL